MTEPPAAGSPRDRRWFVVLAWITLVAFAAFVALMTAGVFSIPRIRRARGRGGRLAPQGEGRR